MRHPPFLRLPSLALCLLFGLLVALPVRAATLTARLDPDTTTPGEPVALALVFEGGQPDGVPSVPAQANLTVTYGGQSSQYIVVNGRVSSSITHSFTLTASQPGTYTIPAITATVGGRSIQSAPLTLRVNRPAPGEDNALARYAFLRVTIPKTEVYQGEVLPVETRLYYISAQEIQMPQLQADGFTLGKPAQPAQGRVQISGNVYNVYVFKQAAAAARTGDLTLGPASCELVLRIPQRRNNNNRSNDPFDLFGFGEPQAVLRKATLQSDPIRIKVLPLPDANKPKDFNGAVGDFNFSATAGPASLAVGDPITLTLKIRGTGAFDSVGMPDAIQHWTGFKSYPPNVKFEPTDTLGMEGTKTLEQVVVPDSTAVRELPAIRFSFFDPGRKLYRTLEQKATPLTVRPSAQPAAQPTVLATTAPAAATAQTAARDLAHIKTRAGNLEPVGIALIERPAFLALQVLPILAWLAALAWRKSQQRLDANPRLRRQLAARAAVAKSLKQLRTESLQASPDDFHADAFRLLQEALGGQLDLPASAITESVIDDHLRQLGAPAGSLETLASLFQSFNHARYAGAHVSADTARTLAQLESILRILDTLPKPGGSSPATSTQPDPIHRLLLLLPWWITFTAATAPAAPSPTPTQKADAATLFTQANHFYEQARYADAIATYSQILSNGLASAPLHFNLANSYLKNNQVGGAIAHYRLAARLDPRDRDIRHNLATARAKVNPPSFSLQRTVLDLLTRLSTNEWTALATTSLWILLGLLSIRELRPAALPRLTRPAWTVAFIFAVVGASAVTSWWTQNRTLHAVVVQSGAVAHFGPFDESPKAFDAREGLEVIVLDRQADWLFVSNEQGLDGWLAATNAFVLTTPRTAR